MPWTEQRPNGTWRACWRDTQGRKRTAAGYVSHAVALRVAGQNEHAARKGAGDEAAGRTPTWGQWSERWLTERAVEPSTAGQDAVRINRYLIPRWGNVRLARIKREHVQAWVRELGGTLSVRGQPLAPSTITRIYHLFSASMKAAVLADVLASSPCVGIKLPTPAPGVERYLTRGEVDAVVYHMHGPSARLATMYRCAVILLTETGLRFGELAGLHWWRVDVEQGLIHVVETWGKAERAPGGPAHWVKAYPKSKKPRAVPISDRALEALDALLPLQADSKTCGLPHSAGRCRSPLVLTNADGGALDVHNFGQRQWADACARAGIDHVRLHDLRHTYASWLIQAGVSLQQVSELLGHSTVLVTQRYAHLATSQHTAVLAALNRKA